MHTCNDAYLKKRAQFSLEIQLTITEQNLKFGLNFVVVLRSIVF